MAAAQESELFTFLTDELPPQRPLGLSRRAMIVGLLLLGLIVAAAVTIPLLLISDKRETLESDLERRINVLAESRAQILGAWLEGNGRVAARIAESDLFRLFVTELAMAGGDLSEVIPVPQIPVEDPALIGEIDPLAPSAAADPLSLQLPYMRHLLTDFIRETNFLSAYLVDAKGGITLSSGGAPDLLAQQKAAVGDLFQQGAVLFGPARAAAAGLVADIYLPIFPVQVEPGEGRPAAVLLLTAPVSAKFGEVLSPGALSQPGERLRLIQENPDGFVELAPADSPPIRLLSSQAMADGELFDRNGSIPFAARMGIGGKGGVYSAGAAIPGTLWWIVQEVETAAAEVELTAFQRSAISVAGLAVFSFAVALAAFWWRMAEGHSRNLAEQFRDLAGHIERQRRLLDSVNSTIADYIGLKDLDGRYRYVNAAFARALGRPPEQLTGQDDAAIFGQGTAELLKLTDDQALGSSDPVTRDCEVFVGKKRCHLQISKAAFPDETGQVSGIVSVARDVTELVEARQRREHAMAQMVSALVRAIELRDPYLAGHSKRVAEFAAETARRLGADPEEIATVEIAANLSQIGKLGIPRDLLNKTERLNDDEIALIQTHINHAEEFLKDIDFDLPVVETIRQMHERPDGTGYPDGLAGDSISRTGRILGACDVFCARLEPRSYRRGISPQDALEILKQNDTRYDPEVVAALDAVVRSVTGEKLIASIDAS